jgi:hypothetical protein
VSYRYRNTASLAVRLLSCALLLAAALVCALMAFGFVQGVAWLNQHGRLPK